MWALASLRPGVSVASELLTILGELDDQERSGASFSDKPLELTEVRNSVSVRHPHSCIDIIF